MIKENLNFTDEITNKIYSILKEKNIEDGVTLFPMLRKENDKLLIGSLIEIPNEDLNVRNKVVRPKYWITLDIDNYNLIELNNISEKDYVDTNEFPIDKEYDDMFKEEEKELSKYTTNKNIQYREFLLNDIQNEIVNSQKKIIDSINNKLIIDNEEVSATDYLNSLVINEIEEKINDLVDLIVTNKYSSIIYYYQQLIKEIIDEYKNTFIINNKKMALAATILDSYYGKYCCIKYFFNV